MFQEDMYQKLKKDWVYKMSIKKQLLIRGLIGAAVGFFICYFITIITSVIIGNGEFYPVVPQAIELFGTEHTTKSKSLNISKSCNGNNCIISTTLKWLRLPTIRSYDVFGAYLEGTHLTNQNIITYVNDINYNQSKIENNGFGVSLKLPTAGNSIVITQIYNVNKSGIVYSSYQHATSNISKSSSMKYSISKKGYGNVFLFENSVSAYYDKMGGVSISI